ncbi:MAG: class I SAM-dependent RNA methyltransferase [Oscillospiraceae bacterium]|jgi:putative N6-adenine-specific DNA methylase|nr:class I SAM-dependent RNA methyltransferase [Oscillospiraceae bacterium]
MTQYPFLVPCLLGLEGLIAEELRGMGAAQVRAENGRVFFSGGLEIAARANIRSRFAERVQIVLGQFEARSFEELFQGAKALPWEEWLGQSDAFPVKGYSLHSGLFSVSDCQSILKKAVVERLKGVYRQDWFDETGPVHQIQFSIMKDKVTLVLDTSGVGLHKRGYRLQAGGAPLKETLAAALCHISKLRPYHTMYDPMCGSGTILIEGALMARNLAPGLRRNFSAERWDQIPRGIWREERELAEGLATEASQFLAFGSDVDPQAIAIAQENARRAGVGDCLRFTQAKLEDFSHPTERGTLITNPPYGERLLDAAQAEELTGLMGKLFSARRGWSYTILSPSETFEQTFGRKADARRKLYNGMLKCQAFMFYKS